MAISVVVVTVISAEVFGYGFGVAVVAFGAAVHGKVVAGERVGGVEVAGVATRFADWARELSHRCIVIHDSFPWCERLWS